jgi:branched-chain amino acid transport system substrate-binding protein
LTLPAGLTTLAPARPDDAAEPTNKPKKTNQREEMFKHQRRACGVGVILAAALTMALVARAAAAGAPYNLDVVLSNTGSIAFLGNSEQQVLQIEEQAINKPSGDKAGGIHGRPVHFVFHDDQSSPQVAVQVTRQILANQPKAIIGSDLVATCNAMAPLMRNGPVLYCLSPGVHPLAGSYVFSAGVSTDDLYRATLTYDRLRGWTKIATLTSTDASGQDAARGIAAAFDRPENKGMQLVASERFNPTDVSADAQIDRMKAANPQAIITWTSGTPLGTVFRALADANWQVPDAITNANMLYQQMKQYAGITPQQLYIATANWLPATGADVPPAVKAANATMFDAFKAANARPDESEVLSWDPALIIVAALNALPEDATPAQLHDYLLQLKDFPGTNGVYDFTQIPQRGLGLSSVVMTRWDEGAGTWVVVSHPEGTPF